MASNRDCRTKPSVSQKLFGKIYVPHIADLILKKYGGSYARYQDQRNTWRAYIPYSAAVEQDFIMETKMFIIFMDKHVKNLANDPEFVYAFVKDVVDYLSAYTMRNPAFPGRTRRSAKEALMQSLWHNFKHIQAMLTRQAVKRAARRERQIRYQNAGKKQRTSAADAYEKVQDARRIMVSRRGPKQR